MKSDDSYIHLAISFDQNYLHPTYALITSLLINNSDSLLHIHSIATGITDSEENRLRNHIETAGSKISFYEVNQDFLRKFVVLNEWTSAVYYRLLFPLLVPKEIKSLLYLDADTVVIRSLKELYYTNLDGFPIGAVSDNYVKIQPLIGINREGEYFNSGVLLIDLSLWNKQQISQKAMAYLLQYPERIKFVDQCALNAVLFNNWKALNKRFNLLYSYIPDFMSKNELSLFLSDKVIIHYTLQRPWNMLCRNRLRNFYYTYLKLYTKEIKLRRYNDFSWNKIPAWLRIRLHEFYIDYPFIQKIWRSKNFMKA